MDRRRERNDRRRERYVIACCVATAVVGALAGCASPETDCASLESTLTQHHAQILQWVDAQSANGRLDPKYQIIDPNVPRPGKFAVPLDPALGFGVKFTARVIVDEADRPTAVFIGNNPWRGFIVTLAPGTDLVVPPTAKRIDDRTVLVCAGRD